MLSILKTNNIHHLLQVKQCAGEFKTERGNKKTIPIQITGKQ